MKIIAIFVMYITLFLSNNLIASVTSCINPSGQSDIPSCSEAYLIMENYRNENGKFKKGTTSRPTQVFWKKEWLIREHITLCRTTSEIALDFNIHQDTISYWLRKHNIKRKTDREQAGINYVIDLPNEKWVEIKESDRYAVSNLGRVKPIIFTNIAPLTSDGTISIGNNRGYQMIQLRINNKAKGFLLHRLVAIAFIPNPLGLPEVNHKDGNKSNNCVSNLEWITHADNIMHYIKNGLSNNRATGIKVYPVFKNQPEIIISIRKLHAEGLSCVKLSKIYNVGHSAILKIVKKQTYKNII